MIKVNNVFKFYGEFPALSDVSFEIGKGEIVGFLGRNGAGKTTLMRILTTYLLASKGKVVIGDYDVSRNSLAVRRMIGYLPETPPLYPAMRVRNYLKLAAQLKAVPAKLCKVQVDRVIGECDLQSVEHKVIADLSKGFKQRVGIAQAIINEPSILILDEPTSGLDPIQIQQVRHLIKGIGCERTVLLSTHILSEIEQMAKRVLILKDGKIAADGSLKSLLRGPEGTKKVFLRIKGYEKSIEDAIKQANGVRLLTIQRDGDQYLISAAVTNELKSFNELSERLLLVKAEILEIKELIPCLEDVFMSVDAHSLGKVNS